MKRDRRPPKTFTREAKRVWTEIVSEWEMSDAAFVVLQQLCESLMLLRKAEKDIDENGLTIDSRGALKSNPALQAVRIARSGILEAWKLLDLREPEEKAKLGRPPGGRRNREKPIWAQNEH